MSSGLLKFIGVLLILGSVGFVTVKAAFTGGYRFFSQEQGRTLQGRALQGRIFDVAAADRR